MPKRTNDGIFKRCSHPKRQWPKCSDAWWFGFYHAGRDHRLSLDKIARMRNERVPTSKSEAADWRDKLRGEIRLGQDPMAPECCPGAEPSTELTVGDVLNRYLADYVGKRETDDGPVYVGAHLRPKSARGSDYQLRIARACDVPAANGQTIRFELKPIRQVIKADIEAIRQARRPHGIVGANRLLARLRHFFNWAIGEGFTTATPFKRGDVSVIKLEMSAEQPRTRRLKPGDEERLLAHANPLLRSLIVAALSTGCRVGELLSLQWYQIRYDEQDRPRWIDLPAAKTKTGCNRALPIGQRLAAELAMRRCAPDGEAHPPTAYVFGDEVGGRVGSVKKGWLTCVLRAHGHQPTWVKGKPGQLTPASREAFRSIGLHFHDLRRQFACTLLESSANLHDVRDFLGHADITTTSRYLATSPERLARALERLEADDDSIRTPFAQSPKPADRPVSVQSDKSVN